MINKMEYKPIGGLIKPCFIIFNPSLLVVEIVNCVRISSWAHITDLSRVEIEAVLSDEMITQFPTQSKDFIT